MQLEEGKAPLTLQGYRYGLRPFLRCWGQGPPLRRSWGVQEHLAGVWRQFEKPHTRFSRVKVLKVFYGWLAGKGLVSVDPTIGITIPRLPDEVPYVLTVAEVDALRRACGGNTFEGLGNRTMLPCARASGAGAPPR